MSNKITKTADAAQVLCRGNLLGHMKAALRTYINTIRYGYRRVRKRISKHGTTVFILHLAING